MMIALMPALSFKMLLAFSYLLDISRFLSHLAFPQCGACTTNELVDNKSAICY